MMYGPTGKDWAILFAMAEIRKRYEAWSDDEATDLGTACQLIEDGLALAGAIAQERDSLAEQLAGEREGREGAERTIKRLIAKVQRDQGYVAVSDLLRFVSAACESCDGSGEVMSVDTVTSLTCGTCRGSGQHPSPPQGGQGDPCPVAGCSGGYIRNEHYGTSACNVCNRAGKQSTSTASADAPTREDGVVQTSAIRTSGVAAGTQAEDARCAFCEKSKTEVCALVAGNTGVAICDECIPGCVLIMLGLLRTKAEAADRSDLAEIVGRMRDTLNYMDGSSWFQDGTALLADIARLEKL